MNRPAQLITLEGGEGAGKSSVLSEISATLETAGIPHILTREPGGSALAESIRGLLLDPTHRGMSPISEALLMFAARADHVERTVRPALAAGKWVVSDRFHDASYAYQGGGRRLPEAVLDALSSWTLQGLEPALTLLLDVPVAVGLKRAQQRSEPDRIELEHGDFFEAVRAAYLERARAQPQRFCVIDASQAQAAVAESTGRALRAFIGAPA